MIGLMKGLTDPMVGLLMGQTAENLAYRFGITRREMDEYAARSHARVLAAQKAGHFDGEVVPLYDKAGKLYAQDDGVREDSTAENLAKLKPFFDRKYGNVTAGNSSQITDGAAWLVLASERAVDKHKLTPLGRIVDSQWAGLDPAQMGLGPVHAATPILTRHGLGLERPRRVGDQRGVRRAGDRAASARGQSDEYCRTELGLPGALGAIDRRSSTSTAARSRSAIRWARRARASCCTCSTCCGAPAASAAWPRSASAAAWAARCWSSASDASTVDALRGAMPTTRKRPMQHWTITRDADGLAWLTFDKADATTNTLSAAVLAELERGARPARSRSAARAWSSASGKANGFIAGADVDEFGEIATEEGALAIVKRGWDTFERLAARAAIRRWRWSAASAWAAAWSSRSRAAIASSSTSPERGWACPR